MTGEHDYAAELQSIRRKLLSMRHDYDQRLKRLEAYGLSQALTDSIGELSSYDNHPADIGDELFERSKDMSLQHMFQRRISEIDLALSAMDSGQYGFCQHCGRQIALERLQAQPTAAYCIDCQQQLEASAGRSGNPPAELVHGMNAAEAAYDPAFDREEAWQQVEQYGTSSSEPEAPEPDGLNDLQG